MCGFLGYYALERGSRYSSWAASSIGSLAHRGPDSEGSWSPPDLQVGFAHLRLAIIDTSEQGHQPMLPADGAPSSSTDTSTTTSSCRRDERRAAEAMRRGVSERALQVFLGHADIRSTRRYARFSEHALVSVLRPGFVGDLSVAEGPTKIPLQKRGKMVEAAGIEPAA